MSKIFHLTADYTNFQETLGFEKDIIDSNKDNKKDKERKKVIETLHQGIIEKNINIDDLLWKTILVYQNDLFYTASGLSFLYTVKCKKNGEYSGELLISRKESSKTLTRSSVMYAFHKVMEKIQIKDTIDVNGNVKKVLIIPCYNGPKSIGQIFGISYIYSLFWKFGLITVPHKIEEKLEKVLYY